MSRTGPVAKPREAGTGHTPPPARSEDSEEAGLLRSALRALGGSQTQRAGQRADAQEVDTGQRHQHRKGDGGRRGD